MKTALLCLAMSFCLKVTAAEVAAERSDVTLEPVHKNLAVREVTLDPIYQRATVKLSRTCPCHVPVVPVDPGPCKETECDHGCPGSGGGKITVGLDLKDASDRDLYSTFVAANGAFLSMTLVLKGNKLVQVSATPSHACCGGGSCGSIQGIPQPPYRR